MEMNYTPRQILEKLDHYIIGQQDAKRSVAVALRNRYPRMQLDDAFKDEIVPKNILMIGPTGVGKTEIARRLARLVRAPFIKVEATKFTEVGYVGRDVESMIRDLMETAIRMVKSEKMELVTEKAEALANERLLEYLAPRRRRERTANPFTALLGMAGGAEEADEPAAEEKEQVRSAREEARRRLAAGELEDEWIEITVEDTRP